MKRARPFALVVIPVMIAALSLVSCTTGTTAFHFVGAEPALSRAVAGELQMFSGAYTLQADDTSQVSDLRWAISYGTNAISPTEKTLPPVDGTATTPITLTGPINGKLYYRICLKSISGARADACETVAVGTDVLWNGTWTSTTGPSTLTGTETPHALTITFGNTSPTPAPLQGTLRSPFLFVTTINGQEAWFEWTSYFAVKAQVPTGYLGSATGSILFGRTLS